MERQGRSDPVDIEGYELHQAVPEEKELIEGILKQAALFIKSKGSKQWNGILEPEKGKDNHDTAGAIKRGEVYFATINEEPAGMFLLWDHQSEWDRTLWSPNSSHDYMYLHRLAIMRKYAGQGISQRLIQSAIETAQYREKKAVRLDCIATKEYLNLLYQSAGFKLVGKKENHDAGEQIADFNLYQYDFDERIS